MIKVSIISWDSSITKNRVFKPENAGKNRWGGNSHWMNVNLVWHDVSIRHSIDLNTSDILPPASADVVLCLDLPKTIGELSVLRKSAPGARLVLLLRESPLLPYWFDQRNFDLFDAVLTYNPKLVDNRKIFRFFLPKSKPPILHSLPGWEDRKNCVLLNSNLYRGITAEATPLHYLRKIKGYKEKGWTFSYKELYRSELSLIYRKRRAFVKASLRYKEKLLDLFGSGWGQRSAGWYYRLWPDDFTQLNARPFVGEKLDLFANYRFVLAFENYTGAEGYISEKLFDAFYAGAVPIYLGDERIDEYVPGECFIDARGFKSYRRILQFIDRCDKSTWLRYTDAARSYLASDRKDVFMPENFAITVANVIKGVLKS